MPTVIVTGSGGLIGSEAVSHFVRAGYDVVGIENDMRARFFGPAASTARTTERLLESHPEFRSVDLDSERLLESHPEFRSVDLDIRDADGVRRLFEAERPEAIIHTAAQP